ncbi:hypothetical protein QIS74_13104 [Colletotrichum tabaci]|uniref:Uncharacterized protein n=1 Tax=Colletotrichum tabaci TaxID=1209068 RepID=A0AAV9SWQ5_9PEZI
MRADAVEESHQDPLGVAPRAASPIDQVGITVLCSPIGGVEKKQDHGPESVHRQQKARKRIQCLYPGDMKIDEELSDYLPPPSPPRPIHQGGGQYAPSQIRHKQSKDEA